MEFPHRRASPTPSYESLLFISCVVSFGCYFGSYMRLPVVPLYARSLGADTFMVGMINAAFLLMAGLLSLPLGLLSDRLGRKLLVSVGLLVISGTSFLLCFSRTAPQLIGIYFLFGIGLAAFGPTMMSFVADFSPATHLGRSYGWYTTALYTGMSFGPAVGGFVAQNLGFFHVFVTSGVFIFLTFWLVLLLLPRSQRPHPGTREKSSAAGARALLRNRPLLACWLATLGGCFGLGMFITFVPLHAQNQHLSLIQIGVVFSAQGLSNAVSRIPFGHLSDRVANRGNLVVIGLTGFVASMAGFAISKNMAHFLLCSSTLGISMGLAFTSVGALIPEVVPPDLRGLAMGGYNSCIYIGMMLSSSSMGAIIRGTGFANGFLLTAAINALLTLIFYFLTRGWSPRMQPVGLVDRQKNS
jgi:DHA1 family multidrug resistance protein-like MFS transporter